MATASVTSLNEHRFALRAAIVNPYLITVAGFAASTAILVAGESRLTRLVLLAAFVAGWSSSWSP